MKIQEFVDQSEKLEQEIPDVVESVKKRSYQRKDSDAHVPAEVISYSDSNGNDEKKRRLSRIIEEEMRLVKGRFRFYETPGASHRVQCKKYANTQMFDKTMIDGQTYEIPLYVARHLNGFDVLATAVNGEIGSCSYVTHGFLWENGAPQPSSAMGQGPGGEGGIPVPTVGIAKRTRRLGFESLEFNMGRM